MIHYGGLYVPRHHPQHHDRGRGGDPQNDPQDPQKNHCALRAWKFTTGLPTSQESPHATSPFLSVVRAKAIGFRSVGSSVKKNSGFIYLDNGKLRFIIGR
jgi:hypothetical protein